MGVTRECPKCGGEMYIDLGSERTLACRFNCPKCFEEWYDVNYNHKNYRDSPWIRVGCENLISSNSGTLDSPNS